MQPIKYTIKFYSDWHAGSGLGAGAGQDSTVIRTKDNLPFLPGKTIKGLVKDAGFDLQLDTKNKALFEQIFGLEHKTDKEGKQGCCFFTDATLPKGISNALNEEKIRHLYRTLASTKIDEDTGTAKDQSLRSMEVAIPMELEGEVQFIEKVESEAVKSVEDMLKAVKCLGANRNRGLGRCEFIIN